MQPDIKICACCKLPLPVDYFYKDRRAADGLYSSCKACSSVASLRHQKKSQAKELRKLRDASAEYIEKRRLYERSRRENGYYEQESIKGSRKRYFSGDAAIKSRRERTIKRRSENPKYRLRMNISCSVWQSLKRVNSCKAAGWQSFVGYSLNQLKTHLERQFLPGMTWENYGKWHIDHKLPVTSFNFTSSADEDFKRCWALENLQPLWAEQNRRKGNRW
jgi:hypothetical protein